MTQQSLVAALGYGLFCAALLLITQWPMKIKIIIDPVHLCVIPPPATAVATTPIAKVARLASVLIQHLLLLIYSSSGSLPGRLMNAHRPQKSAADLDVDLEVCVEYLEFAMQYPDQVIGLHCELSTHCFQ